MSIWTHAVGCLRVDGSPEVFGSDISGVRAVLGRIVTFDDLCRQEGPQDVLETTLPMGSEGSMRYHVIEYDKGLCWLTVAVWGDLRNYDNAQAVVDWFKGLCARLNDPATGKFWVRDAIIRATCESSKGVLTWSYGLGEDEPEEAKPCSTCGGTKVVDLECGCPECSGKIRPCPDCAEQPCPTCGGNPGWCHRGSCAFVPGGRLNQRGPCDDAKTCANFQPCPDCKKEPVGGRCCDCGYEGTEETECPKREDKTHCEHWWDGKGS